jgi:hypothetical protein
MATNFFLFSAPRQGKLCDDAKARMLINKHSKINLKKLENGMKLYNWNTCTIPT